MIQVNLGNGKTTLVLMQVNLGKITLVLFQVNLYNGKFALVLMQVNRAFFRTILPLQEIENPAVNDLITQLY